MILCKDLSKNFANIQAVQGLNFSVDKGEILGFLGPNGAGKSTTMKMLTGFLKPTSGTATVAGFDIVDNSRIVREKIGYLPENAPLYSEMTVFEFLTFITEVRGLFGQNANESLKRAIELTSLFDVLNQRIETLSKGFKRRVGLAQAILHDPEILILDEPTDGLDPNQKYEVRKLIEEMAKKGEKSIILSTHILEEVEEVCTRAIVISKGKIVADDTPANLKSRSCFANSFLIKVQNKSLEKIKSEISSMPGFEDLENSFSQETFDEGSSSLRFKISEKGVQGIVSLGNALKDFSSSIDNISIEEGRLDQVFRDITK